jgi:hypothetical protein
LRFMMAGFVVVGAIIGVIFLAGFIDEMVNAPQREIEATQENLAREVDYGTPILPSLVGLDDASIMGVYADAGFTIYDLNSANAEGAGLDIIRLPEGISVVDAGLMYSQGVSNLSSSDAARLLNGSWRLTVGRSGYIDMTTRYADFTSGSAETAIQNAIAQQGLAESSMGEAGVDNAGNTFQAGSVVIGDVGYNWRISACALSEVYSVDGLPSDAIYVGIRMYQ